ncbi:MAG TPA: hypothetical protein PK737_00630 [Bacilli bacterium]|nr:hypothetical protein [Bacilli bacterium]
MDSSTTTTITSTDSLATIGQELITLGSAMLTDLQSIITVLKGIQIDGDNKEIINSALNQLNSIVNEVTLPDALGKSLLTIIESFTTVDANVKSLFSDWGGVLSTVTSALTGAVSSGYQAVTANEGYTSAPLLSYFKETTATLSKTTTDLLSSTNKLVYSFTGNSIATNISNLATKAVGTISSLISGIGTNNSAISGFLSRIF